MVSTPGDPYWRYGYAVLKLGLSVFIMAALSLILPLYLPASKADPGLLIVVCLPTLIFASGFLGLFDAFFDGGKEAIGPFKRVVTLFLPSPFPPF